MKKFCVVLVIILILSLSLFAACEPCEHQWLLQESHFTDVVDIQKNYVCEKCAQTKSEKVKNLVLIIGDGMGLEHISAAQLALGEFDFTSGMFTS